MSCADMYAAVRLVVESLYTVPSVQWSLKLPNVREPADRPARDLPAVSEQLHEICVIYWRLSTSNDNQLSPISHTKASCRSL